MKFIILGGGLAGLTAAYKLSKKGSKVTILEKEGFLGGLASSYEIKWGGKKLLVPKTYHHILAGDKTTIKLLEELNLDKKLHRKKVKTGFVYKNKIFGFSTPTEILKFPLPFIDKFRLAKFILKVSKKKNWDDTEKMNARDWIIKEAGQKNFDMFFEQLIRNKFNQPAEEISAAWFGTRFAVEPSSFLKKFGWVEGGIQQLIDRLKEEIEKNGGKIKTNVKLEKIVKKGNLVEYSNKGKIVRENSDIIISTIPPESFLEAIIDPSETVKKEMDKIEYLGCICVCIGLNYSPTKYYWLNILDKDIPFRALFNYTQLFEDLAPQGKSILFLVTYLRKSDEFWKKSEKEILNDYINSLEKMFPGCKDRIEWHKLVKFDYSEAIFNLGFKNPPISDGNIYFAGIYRIFPKIRNMASAIESGLEVVETLEKKK